LKTVKSVIDWIDARIPNPLTLANKLIYLNDIVSDGDFRTYNTKFEILDTQTYSSNYRIALPAGVTVKDLFYVGLTSLAYSTDNVMGTTTPFTEYKYLGLRDPSRPGYFQDQINSTDNVHNIGIYPAPDNAYHIRLIHKPYQSGFTSDNYTTNILRCDDQLVKYAQYKLGADVLRSLAFPRIDLANNYELEAMQALGSAKINYHNHMSKISKRQLGYKDWWC
jgi:hypothetical protein